MDIVADPATEWCVVMSASQILKTEFLNNICGYYTQEDPAPMLMVQPTERMAVDWVKDRFDPMIRDSPCFKGLLTEDNLHHKTFPGGYLAIGYAKSPATLASRPIRILMFDEVDRYDLSAKNEGDPITIGLARTTTFYNRKIIAVSSPTLDGVSRIAALFAETDQRFYNVPCPNCSDLSVLNFEDIQFDRADPLNTAVWICPKCAGAIEHYNKRDMLANGRWIATAPFVRKAGFQIGGLYSPWFSWGEMASEFVSAKTEETRQTWQNTRNGQTYKAKVEKVDNSALHKAREYFPGNDRIPEGVLLITAGVDNQDDRMECDFYGYGLGEETWFLGSHIVRGNLKDKVTAKELNELLLKRFTTEKGRILKVSATFIDSQGKNTQSVYDFCRGLSGRKIYPIKGRSIDNPFDSTVEVLKSTVSKKYNKSLILVHVSKIKKQVYDQLRDTLKVFNDDTKENLGPGYWHFPIDDNCDEDFFKSLSAEHLEKKKVNGRSRYSWKSHYTRNERLDCAVYSRSAMLQVSPKFEVLAKRAELEREEKRNPKAKKRPARRRSNWVTG